MPNEKSKEKTVTNQEQSYDSITNWTALLFVATAAMLVFTLFIYWRSESKPQGEAPPSAVEVPSPTEAVSNQPIDLSNVPKQLMLGIQWVIVPLILIIIFIYAVSLPYRTDDYLIRRSGTAGILAGLVAFIIFVVAQQKRGLEFSTEIPSYDFDMWAAIATVIGLGLGWGVTWLVNKAILNRALGLLVLTMVAATIITLYSFLFIKDVRSTVAFVSLGTIFGSLLYIVLYPEKIIHTKGRATQQRAYAQQQASRATETSGEQV